MIDMHAHYLSPSVLRQASAGSVPVGLAPDGRSLRFPSGPSRPVPLPLCDLTDRLGWMDERAIERQILGPWMDITGDDLSPAAATAWCRTMNDSCARDIGNEPRFGALAALPMVDGRAAAAELGRCVSEMGFVGGAIPTQVAGVDLDEAGLEPLWEAASGLGMVLFMHPFRVMGGSRMRAHFLNNVCGNPFETTLAALRLYFDRTFDRWPDLRILLAHGGGVLPTLAGRAAHASRYGPGFDRAVDHPDSILESFYYDVILHDPRALTLLMNTVEPARIAAGTDYPFPMILDRPTDHIQEAGDLAGLTEDELNRILSGTATHLLPG
ncbi:amidohydrolase family protein [Candidatus Spongiisocius sp.]|uniref:amidohydrolase family protein n=1 Tax=Candidatus Spongiisocius sp. TaxID=3101273 RepID=UPI003B5C7689